MPLRDHFHGVVLKQRRWESFHGTWPATIIRHLNSRLPHRYHAELQVHVGTVVESGGLPDGNGGVTTAVWAPPQPSQTMAVDLPAQDVFEVRIHDDQRGQRLVAAIELVSPGNKDRPESRRAFAIKCAAYLQQGVSVIVVDIVTERRDNLHVQLMDLLERTEAAPWPAEQSMYAVAYRTTKENDAWRMDLWTEPLALARPLPTLPLWLASNLAIPLDLEASYEETCQVLRIL